MSDGRRPTIVNVVISSPIVTVIFVSSHPSFLLPTHNGRLAVVTSVQSLIIIRAPSNSNQLYSSRNLIASAGDVTKTFPAAGLNERVREMVMRWLRASTRSLSTASLASGADADKSNDNYNDASSNEGGERNATDLCHPPQVRMDNGVVAGLWRGVGILWWRGQHPGRLNRMPIKKEVKTS